MPLAPGDKLGPYEIAEPIGKGGMGEVYRAHDTRLRRDVAIKVAAEHFSERFEREARAVAALNHPNVCTLHDVGPNYLVMELVEGPTLADRIREDALSLEEALPIARQIAAALEAAHEKGITHRDLKPGNVKIKSDGLVKVLDFGLAKLAPSAQSSGIGDESPTLSMAATRAGVILGTAAYMSPEQARGKANIDKRSDIWAFGVVFYEMLTGRRMFQGEDLTEVLASVVKEQPDLGRAPREVRRLLARCLEKDPAKRLRDIGDVWDLLDTGVVPQPAAAAPGAPRMLWIAAAGVFACLAIAFAVLWLRQPAPELSAVQFAIDPPRGASFVNAVGSMAVSPDGRSIVFGARGADNVNMLWLRTLDSTESRVIAGTDGGNFPFWSPDSKSIGFRSANDGKIKRVDVSGGAPFVLAEAPQEPTVTTTGAWNRDGVVLFGGSDGMHRVPSAGGLSTLITKVDAARREVAHGYPQFLPDGKRFLFFVASSDPDVQGVYASSLDRPEQTSLVLRAGNKALYAAPRGNTPAYLLWVQEQNLLAQPFDVDALKLEGDPLTVAQDLITNANDPVRAAFWSDGGLLVFRTGNDVGARRRVVWMDRDGKSATDVFPQDSIGPIMLSPDAQRLAVSRMVGGTAFDIWIYEFARGGVFSRLTFDAGVDSVPVWSPDGRRIAFISERGGQEQIYVKDVSGAGEEVRLTEGPNSKQPLHWSSDGRYLLYRERDVQRNLDLYALPLDGDRKPIPVANTAFAEMGGQISPDGKWIAYSSTESGPSEIYVRSSPWLTGQKSGGTGRWQVSNGGGTEPKWRNDGLEIYYETPGAKIMAAAVRMTGSGFATDAPRELFTGAHVVNLLHGFDVTRDGRRFVLVLPTNEVGSDPLNVIVNWQAVLRK